MLTQSSNVLVTHATQLSLHLFHATYLVTPTLLTQKVQLVVVLVSELVQSLLQLVSIMTEFFIDKRLCTFIPTVEPLQRKMEPVAVVLLVRGVR